MQHLWNKVIPSFFFFFSSPTWTLLNLLYSDTGRRTEACMALVIYDAAFAYEAQRGIYKLDCSDGDDTERWSEVW